MKVKKLAIMPIFFLGFLAVVLVIGSVSQSIDECDKLNDKNTKRVDEYQKMVFETNTKAMSDSLHREYIDTMNAWSDDIKRTQSLWESKCS